MKTMNFKTNYKTIIADTLTPVNIYLKIRNQFKHSLLLESADYNSRENNSKSFICFDPVLTFSIDNKIACIKSEKGEIYEEYPVDFETFHKLFNSFKSVIKTEKNDQGAYNGLFGYIAYNSVEYFETVKLKNKSCTSYDIPDMVFSFYKYILVFNHFNSNLSIIENTYKNEKSQINKILEIIQSKEIHPDKFKSKGPETSNLSDEEYRQNVSSGKYHCQRGDVFQIVLSRQFRQSFVGDDFNVYRSLRSINPSPYLFYYDYGDYRLFGSSPESQIRITEGKAVINPIAGTYRRTGNKKKDEASAEALLHDKKENAEHVMLVDLARNDLSRECENVELTTYKEIQYFSHVIHLVSEVSGEFSGDSSKIITNTFPAGTLSGAPKIKAMQLIDKYENQHRGFYGGAVGFIGLNDEVNLAIAIRSFVSMNSTLFYRAGAGVVVHSDEESELQEVNNKLSALKKAIEKAEHL